MKMQSMLIGWTVSNGHGQHLREGWKRLAFEGQSIWINDADSSPGVSSVLFNSEPYADEVARSVGDAAAMPVHVRMFGRPHADCKWIYEQLPGLVAP